jgi:hypothetical protein
MEDKRRIRIGVAIVQFCTSLAFDDKYLEMSYQSWIPSHLIALSNDQ